MSGSWELADRLGVDMNQRTQFKRALKRDSTNSENDNPTVLTISLGDFVTLGVSEGEAEPWVAQVVEICRLSVQEQRQVGDGDFADPDTRERCGLRWLYRQADFTKDVPHERHPRCKMAPREVCLTDAVDEPLMNSLNVIDEVVRVVSDVDEVEDLDSSESGPVVQAERPRPAYFCKRFYWVEGVAAPEKVPPDLEGKYWRAVGSTELAKMFRLPSARPDLFWTRKPPSSRIPRKSTGSGKKAKGEDTLAALFDKTKKEPETEQKKLTLSDLTLVSVLPEEQLALVRKTIVGLTDEQLSVVTQECERDIKHIVEQFDGGDINEDKEFEERRDELVEGRRHAFWNSLPKT